MRALASSGDGPVGARVSALHAANAQLWAAEDAVRDRALPDAEVVRLKREIDRLNLARHAAVRAIDAWYDEAFAPRCTLDTPGVLINSESIGQMMDRLSVLALKLAHYPAHAPQRPGLVVRQALLMRCVDRSLRALAEGNALPQGFDEAKTYGA